MCRTDRGVVLGLYRHGPRRDLLEYALTLGVRGIDTTYSYQRYCSHRTLAAVAGDLLPQFTVSTKVGYFPTGDPVAPTRHTLDPAQLRAAVEQSAADLGQPADFVLVHNPEHSLAGLDLREGRDRLVDACGALADAVKGRLCRAWGIATWDPRLVVQALESNGTDSISRFGARPDVLMLRSGLTVPAAVLTAGEMLCHVLGVSPAGRWGMSPFGGTVDPVWDSAALGAFMAPGEHASPRAAAMRMAYELPRVERLAVGTQSRGHLAELVAATQLAVDDASLQRYRRLIGAADAL